jgi:hypothetical protein
MAALPLPAAPSSEAREVLVPLPAVPDGAWPQVMV